jgi:hypothetical protein
VLLSGVILKTRRSTIVRARFARNISNSSSDTERSLIFGMCFDPSPLTGLMSSSLDIPVVGRKYAPQRVSVVATYWP